MEFSYRNCTIGRQHKRRSAKYRNGFRPSVQSDVETGITNVVLGMKEEQTSSRSGLEMEMKEGILVTRVDGVFAGADSTTGKFSLIAGGRVVRNGREAETFREVTISGDFFECLGSIKRQAMNSIQQNREL